MEYVGENVYKCTLYLCNVSKFKKCRKKGCNFYFKRKCNFSLTNEDTVRIIDKVWKIHIVFGVV